MFYHTLTTSTLQYKHPADATVLRQCSLRAINIIIIAIAIRRAVVG